MRLLTRCAVACAATLLAAAISGPALAAAPAATDVQPPSAPTGLWECAADWANAVPFCWTASTDDVGVVGYDIYMRQGDTFVLHGGSTYTTYTATNLIAGQWYTFYVVAKDAAGNRSAPSALYTARAQEGLPVPPNCHVTYTGTNRGRILNGTVKITNIGGTPVSGWTLRFTFPGDQRVKSGWNGIWSQSGTAVTVKNLPSQPVIRPGQTVTTGFTGIGSTTGPAAFTLNGVTCARG
ncbi:cellulose binding domain-containing protein [Spongiactinospora sp. TRM90649]|uniref:cellulose binding domain-containing protein n=1 Tax=Spongiactinospora sp. TRM90649 TaxID=3031114 RepID=UPI0023F9C8E2|nr:cellulose binding domain-containing protein [Spongiactinospora sp. TRM90649]MDF5752085.1 cellulose binding domain-containing protein [Spongiactinospora sp. TRM90649]